MPTRHVVALAGALIAVTGCTRTVYVAVPTPEATSTTPASAPAPARPTRPEPVRSAQPAPRENPRPTAASTLGIPTGHLPEPGHCRIWMPGTPPGRQTYDRSKSCDGISRAAPGGAWIVYRPARDHKLVHVRVTDRDRPGTIVVVHVFDAESGRYLYDDDDDADRAPARQPTAAPRGAPAAGPIAAAPRTAPPADPRRAPQERPGPVTDPGTSGGPIPVPPPAAGPIVGATTTQPSPGERRKPAPEQAKDVPLPPPVLAPEVPGPTSREVPLPPPVLAPAAPGTAPAPAPGPGPAAPQPAPTAATLDVPPGHFPDAGKCRVWIPGTPPGRQPQRDSRACAEVTTLAPAGSWVLYRPGDGKGIHVKVVDARRPGVIVAVRIYDDARRFVREEQP